MEVSFVKDNLKIKGSKITVVIDPVSKIEAQVILLTTKNNPNLDKVEGKKLVITGAGEYEAGGMAITGKSAKEEVIFKISDSTNMLFLTSSAISKVKESDEYDCILVKVADKITEDLFSLFESKCFVLYGDLSQVSLKSEKVEKTNKVNLKKTAEISGKIFLLSA